MVVVGRGGIGSKFLSKDYPVVEGLTAGTTVPPEDNILEPNDEVRS